MPYLKLFHGRASFDEYLDGWGEDGPIFGPFAWFHSTYGCEIKFDADNHCELTIVDDLVYYDGMFYGDWSIFEGPVFAADAARLTRFDPQLAKLPEQFRGCVCMQPGHFHCGVPGILAHREQGKVPFAAKVERCDKCRRYPTDSVARQKLIELGLIGKSEPQAFTVHCYVTVRVLLKGVIASTPQDAARLAAAQFDWEVHRCEAESTDQITEYLVDCDSAADYSQSQRFDRSFEVLER